MLGTTATIAITDDFAIAKMMRSSYLASAGYLQLPSHRAELNPRDRRHRCLAAWCSHGSSYTVGIFGGLVVVMGV